MISHTNNFLKKVIFLHKKLNIINFLLMDIMSARIGEIDLNIIRELRNDGRISITELSRKLGVSRPTVTNHLGKLTRGGLVLVTGGLRISELGYKMASVGLEVKGDQGRKTLEEHLKACPRVQAFFRTSKKANLTVVIWGEDDNTVNSVIESLRDYPDVDIVETKFLGTPIYGKTIIALKTGDNGITPCGKKCTSCSRYNNSWCPGCPDTMFYSNPMLK